ncbi:MAG: TonB family protein [Candidatus Omnitrophica bacterium]|nr:TonB family protein [Candidatus Omnitrophota bacterium]
MTRKYKILCSLILFSSFLLAHKPVLITAENEETIRMIVGESKVFPTLSPTRVVIGNPKVADIVDVTNTEISVNAKLSGVTTLVYWDNYGEQSMKIRVVPEDTIELKRRVDSLISGLGLDEVKTNIADDEGKILIMGRVKNPQDRERIGVALGALKDKTIDLIEVKEEQAVVEIDVQILELDKDGTTSLGFSWPGQFWINEVASPGIATTGVTSIVQGASPSTSFSVTNAGTKLSNLYKVVNYSRNAFGVKLDALIQEGKARILSRPRLACQSGKEAELLVGGEKPIFSTTLAATTGNSGTQVEYKEYGIKLNIKPTVGADEKIKLNLKVDVSELQEAETIGTTTSITAKAYPLTKRSTSTELFLEDEQTLAIGGLIKQKTSEDLRKFPWLADIPVLGSFFRQKITTTGGGSGEKGDTELFITLTPKIVSRESDSKKNKKEPEPRDFVKPSLPVNTSSSPISNYASLIQKRITDNLEFPAAAKKSGFEGTVKLSLHLSYQGDLLDTVVKKTSGYKILDESAVKTARGIGSYPPFPPAITSQDIWIDVPIAYRLD